MLRAACLAVAALLVATTAAGAELDELRIIELQQQVHNLERQVETLQRELDELRTQSRPSGAAAAPRAPAPAAQPSTSAWLSAANWNRIRPGMSELEVIQILGPPASVRPIEGGRAMLYAMEIGRDGFLAGKVTFEDRRVAEIEKPVLK